VRGSQFWQRQAGWELGTDGTSNICELLINVVTNNKPKVLKGLDQKVRGMAKALLHRFTQSMIPSAERQALTYLIELVEHGKPNCLHWKWKATCKGSL
jgi:hypothetical protein